MIQRSGEVVIQMLANVQQGETQGDTPFFWVVVDFHFPF